MKRNKRNAGISQTLLFLELSSLIVAQLHIINLDLQQQWDIQFFVSPSNPSILSIFFGSKQEENGEKENLSFKENEKK